MNRSNKFLCVFSLLFLCPTIQCVVIGSETAVSVQPLASFPAADTDNTMLGFGWFKNGFSFEDSTTTCTFNSVYPVSGTVDVNGGTLTLLQDLIFHNVTQLNGLGTIFGNNYALDLCTSITALPTDATSIKDAHVFLNNDLVITSTITLQGNCSFNGHGNSLIMGSNGALVLDSNAHVTFQEMEIKGLHGSNLQCVDNTGRILLNDIVWEQNQDFTFAKGSIFMQDMVTFMGTSTFFYSSSQTSTLGSNSTWCLTNGIHLNIGRDPITHNEPMAFTDSTSVMKLSNCGYDIASTGITLTKGTIFFENYVDARITSTSFATGVTVGTGNPADDFTVYFSPGCSVTQHGHMTYNNYAPDGFKSTSNTTLLVRGANSNILANTNLTMPEITVRLVSDTVPPLLVSSGKTLSFNKTSITLPSVAFDVTGYQQNVYTYILPGNGSIFFSKGVLPLYLIIANAGNEIRGNGSLNGMIILANAAAELKFDINGYVGNTLALNGGKVTLANDLMLYNNGILTGPGTIDLTNRVLRINSSVSSWTTPLLWKANEGTINLEQKLSLISTWTVQGTCIIDGNNNELEFLENGEIVIDSNSELYLKNIRLQSIADVNIRCVDDTGVLILDDVYWTQIDDFIFQKGSIKIINDVDLVGSYTFYYDSTQTSTVQIKSTLKARDHLNLKIGKKQIIGAQEPLALEDDTSLIIVDNAQWSVIGEGMRLTKGRVICQNDVLIDIASTSSLEGLKLGDSTQAGDLTLEFRPGASVRLPRGHVICDWYAPNNVKSQSNTAQLIRNATNTFYCNCNIVLSNLNIQTEPGAALNMAAGKTFSYDNCLFEVPGGVYVLDGAFYNAYTNILNGNDSLYLTYGALPLYTVVNGTGNVLAGNGSVAGALIFASPSAQLTWAMNGSLANYCALNGGKVILASNLILMKEAQIHGPGTVDIGTQLLKLSPKPLSSTTPLNLTGTDAKIELKAELSLASTWTFTGNCTLQGNGNTIDLGSTGGLVIDTNSTLTLRNVKLINIGDTTISSVDNTGALIIDNVTWIQANSTYTFTPGTTNINSSLTQDDQYIFYP